MSYFDFLKRTEDKKHYVFHCRARDPVTGGIGFGALAGLMLFAPTIIFVILVLVFYVYQPNVNISIPSEIGPFVFPLLLLVGLILMFAFLNRKTKGCSFLYWIAIIKNKRVIYEYDGKIVGEMRRFTPIKPVTVLYPKGSLVTIKIEK